MLAGISTDYYLRLERGRDIHPSVQVLESLARALQLDDVERRYLLDLGAPKPRRPRRRRQEHVPDRVHHLLAAIDAPAFVEGRWFDVLAVNDLAPTLSPRLRPGENRIRSFFLDPEERALYEDWERSAAAIVATLRIAVGDDVEDPRFAELVGELSLRSERFRMLWARHDVRPLGGGVARLQHPTVGGLELYREKLPLEDDLIVVVYYAAPGSASAEKLQLLASLARTVDAPRADAEQPG